MKKLIPWLIVAAVVLLVGLLIALSGSTNDRRFDGRVTLREKDNIPYGTSFARSLLPSLLPGTYVASASYSPVLLHDGAQKGRRAELFFADNFDADSNELNSIYAFAQEGNSVFIVSRRFSAEAASFFDFTNTNTYYFLFNDEDSLRVSLQRSIFPSDSMYTYPGRRFDNAFSQLDTAHAEVLGRDYAGHPDFIAFGAGQGKIYIHAAPMAFSNYFLLHKKNVDYFRLVMSVLPQNLEQVEWNEYYLTKPSSVKKESSSSLFSVLLRYPGLKWGLLLGLGLLLLLLLLGSRRRQQKIQPHAKPQNDSLDFVKTVGRLYYDRRDHQNLANKMAVYFLEHVRSTYKLPTHTLDEDFVRLLHFKSGYPSEALAEIVDTVRRLRAGDGITEAGLSAFHQELELFYQNV